jgi:hypothetical protein
VKLREISSRTHGRAAASGISRDSHRRFPGCQSQPAGADYNGIDPETNLEGAYGIGRGQDYFNNPQTRSFVFTISSTTNSENRPCVFAFPPRSPIAVSSMFAAGCGDSYFEDPG